MATLRLFHRAIACWICGWIWGLGLELSGFGINAGTESGHCGAGILACIGGVGDMPTAASMRHHVPLHPIGKFSFGHSGQINCPARRFVVRVWCQQRISSPQRHNLFNLYLTHATRRLLGKAPRRGTWRASQSEFWVISGRHRSNSAITISGSRDVSLFKSPPNAAI